MMDANRRGSVGCNIRCKWLAIQLPDNNSAMGSGVSDLPAQTSTSLKTLDWLEQRYRVLGSCSCSFMGLHARSFLRSGASQQVNGASGFVAFITGYVYQRTHIGETGTQPLRIVLGKPESD